MYLGAGGAFNHDSLMDAASDAFDAPFVDSHGNVASFLEHVDACRSRWAFPHLVAGRKSVYSPYFAVVQSSMMGKTRLFHEVPRCSDTYLMYVCLRKPSDPGYPPSIPTVYDSLVFSKCTMLHYASFLYTSIHQLLDFIVAKRGTNRDWFQLQTKNHGLEFWNDITGHFV